MRGLGSRISVWVLAVAGLTACGDSSTEEVLDRSHYVETGDLEAITARGRLRVAIPGNLDGGPSLPRQGSPVTYQQDLAVQFADSLGLDVELVPVWSLGEMLPMLEQGRADIIAANLTITDQRREHIDFSVPIAHVREQLLVGVGDNSIHKEADLAGKRIMADPHTSFWGTLQDIKSRVPSLEIVERRPRMGDEDVLDAVAAGAIDGTVRDSNIVAMYLGYRQDIKPAMALTADRAIAWGVRPETPALRKALNQFLTNQQLTRPTEDAYSADFDEIKQRKVLRMLLRNTAASYYLWRGELRGFEYELVKRFADQHRLRLEVVVPPSRQALLSWLREGRGDIAGGFWSGKAPAGVAWSRRYHQAQPTLVGPAEDAELTELSQLRGRRIAVVPNSPAWIWLVEHRAEYGYVLKPIGEDLVAEEIVDKVAARDYDLAVIDDHRLAVELALHDDVRRLFPIGDEVPQHWAVRGEDSGLIKALNAFLKKEYRGVFYNIIYKRYFENEHRIRSQQSERADRGDGSLSPFDKLVRKYGEQYAFDWRLITAQMYQESRFDPKAKSNAGAKGLMQVMPRTAKQFGFTKLYEPEIGLHAGVKYMDWVRDRFPEELPITDRVWFSLAAYNAGFGHVSDARRLAAKQGWDRDRWFGNVERAMLLLSKRKYAKQARYGYVRGAEPVKYVAQIRSRYLAYVSLLEQQQGKAAEPMSEERFVASLMFGELPGTF